MAKWASADFLDGGLVYLKATATKMLLVSAYSAADSYATVVGNIVASADMTGTDFVLSSASANRLLTFGGGKSATASAGSGATPDLHIAFTNGTDTVIYVTDETSDQVVTSGNPVNFPELTYTCSQPT